MESTTTPKTQETRCYETEDGLPHLRGIVALGEAVFADWYERLSHGDERARAQIQGEATIFWLEALGKRHLLGKLRVKLHDAFTPAVGTNRRSSVTSKMLEEIPGLLLSGEVPGEGWLCASCFNKGVVYPVYSAERFLWHPRGSEDHPVRSEPYCNLCRSYARQKERRRAAMSK